MDVLQIRLRRRILFNESLQFVPAFGNHFPRLRVHCPQILRHDRPVKTQFIHRAGHGFCHREHRRLTAHRLGFRRQGFRNQRIQIHGPCRCRRVVCRKVKRNHGAQTVADDDGFLYPGLIHHGFDVRRPILKTCLAAANARRVSPQIHADKVPTIAQRRCIQKLFPTAAVTGDAVQKHNRSQRFFLGRET